ncbi:hypothetical protein F5882DRAFT_513939 [Hyaloscypha sp. PMI_1271]|nr:hypothetical protein F5882DRAFT_513939 [Hyaloscypha sp. PMI_1271]
MQESQQFFQGLCAKTEKELEETEKELNAEIEKDRDNWKHWAPAELIRRWETGNFDYKHFKDTENAKLLRQAYKICSPEAEPRSVSRIMRVSAQVGAGWYKTPLEAPHCDPHREKSDAASAAATPVKATPAKKVTPAKTVPPKATPVKTTPVQKTLAKATPAKKATGKKASAEKIPIHARGVKRVRESMAGAEEKAVQEEAQQLSAVKKVKVSM